MIGEGLDSARVDVESSEVAFTAVTESGDAPAEVHLQPDAVVPDGEYDVSLEVVSGRDETPIDAHVSVAVHLSDHPERAIHYRNGEPITRDASTRYGDVLEVDGGEKSVIQTYTDADGRASVDVDERPGVLERLGHWVRVQVPVGPIGSVALAGVGVVVGRRVVG
ncbi:hypothetical protein ACFQHN_25965 [Natrialbaceae archaeon GCM10025896]